MLLSGHTQNRRTSYGFTLLEIAIVLVIAGLLAGGILVGRELIHAAEIRATLTQLERFNAAVNTFKGKYGCLPGDCDFASDIGFDADSNGNGDGFIGFCNSANQRCSFRLPSNSGLAYEFVDFWYQLGAANLINEAFLPSAQVQFQGMDSNVFTTPGPGNMSPKTKLRATRPLNGSPGGWLVHNRIVFFDGEFAPGPGSWAGPNPGGSIGPFTFLLTNHFNTQCCNLLSLNSMPYLGAYLPADVYIIDSKIDDGRVHTGIARGWNETLQLATNEDSYVTVRSGQCGVQSNFCACSQSGLPPFNDYNLAYAGDESTAELGAGLCSLVIKASF